MSTIVQPYQEEGLKATEAADGNLLIEPHDVSLQNIDKKVVLITSLLLFYSIT